MCDNPAVVEQPSGGLPTWTVVLTAIVGPFVLAILFLVALQSAHISDQEWLADPNAGYRQAHRDQVVLATYGLAQLAFLIAAPWRMTGRPGTRVIFVAIALPLCLIVSLVAVASQIAG